MQHNLSWNGTDKHKTLIVRICVPAVSMKAANISVLSRYEQDRTSHWLDIMPLSNLNNRSIYLPVYTTLAHKVSPQRMHPHTMTEWMVFKALWEIKWNKSGFMPSLCTYRLNWAEITAWGWWDDWDDTVLQTQDSKFEPWRSEAEHATSRSRRFPTILTFTRGWGRNDREPNPELWRERQGC